MSWLETEWPWQAPRLCSSLGPEGAADEQVGCLGEHSPSLMATSRQWARQVPVIGIALSEQVEREWELGTVAPAGW